jgi:hypothetical protein
VVCSLEHPCAIDTTPSSAAKTNNFLTLISGSSSSSGD